MKTATSIIFFTALLVGLLTPPAEGGDVSKQLIHRLEEMTPEQAVAMKYGWDIPGQYVSCVGSLPIKRAEVPVLVCQWGPGANVITNRHLFWKEGKHWRSQPYPSEGIRGTAGFSRLYQDGNELVVIMNVGVAQTAYAEQPQLLRRKSSRWRLVWMPRSRDWSQFHSTVQFEGVSLNRFSVWADRFVLPKEQLWPFAGEFGIYYERWQRSGDQYVRVSRTEAPQPELGVVHFVKAVADGDDAEARKWATGGQLVRDARAQGLPKASAIGFRQPRWVERENGDVTFALNANNYEGKPSWRVTVTWHQGRWVVSNIQPGDAP